MKQRFTMQATRLLFVITVMGSFLAFVPPPADNYVVISWNDLGMHCANKDFQNLCILPPYNNLRAQVILKGDAGNLPQLVTNNMTVNYSVPGNTTSTNKTNFWDYAYDLFGVNLPPDTGLTGAGLSGSMAVLDPDNDHFFVDGIPITPYQDDNLDQEQPYQLALIELFDDQNTLLASAQPVIPVSNEIGCVSSGCHSSETNILYSHENEGGFDPNATPILCAECHADNALGTPGHAGVPPLSQVIHQAHGEETNDCYKCHPGQNTQCLRDTMHTLGLVCQDCHGSVSHVGQTIAQGREPWLDEPHCGDAACHGSNYAEEPNKLFKNSRGHGGLFCSACHGSPHAIYTSSQPNDNLQIIDLQGYAGILKECSVCHGYNPTSPGPHGYLPTAVEQLDSPGNSGLSLDVPRPNPFKERTQISFDVPETGKVYLDVFDGSGKKMARLVNDNLDKGHYQVTFGNPGFAAGIYFVKLSSLGNEMTQKMIISK